MSTIADQYEKTKDDGIIATLRRAWSEHKALCIIGAIGVVVVIVVALVLGLVYGKRSKTGDNEAPTDETKESFEFSKVAAPEVFAFANDWLKQVCGGI